MKKKIKRIKRKIKKKVNKILGEAISTIGFPSSKEGKIRTIELDKLRKDLEPYPENDEMFTILRKKIIRKWLSTHSKNGSLLKKEREIESCYHNCGLCPIKKGKEDCDFCRRFFRYDFCFYVYLIKKEQKQKTL